ncbi:MAG: outer membrane beta-barrel protein [Pseudomonadota bacterium]
MIKRIAILFSCLFILLILLTNLSGDVIAADGPLGQASPGPDQLPVGQVKTEVLPTGGQTGAEVFGNKGGFFHPFLLVEEEYTDNLYNTESGREDDYITTFSPGIWLAFPSNREKLLEMGTSNTSPGGLKVSRVKPDAARRFQSYLLYAPEFVYYETHSDHDSVNHKAEGQLQYNFNMGLSLDAVDQFNSRSEVNDNGVSRRLDEYQDNLFNFLAEYDSSEKFRFRFDYSNYALDYKDEINDFRNRVDNSFAAYIFYKFKAKTSLFAEYEFADIKYDTDFDSNSSTEDRYYAGLDWEVTAKTKGRVKLGYIEKVFDAAGVDEQSAFSMEVQGQHNFTPKRALRVTGFRKFNESIMISSFASLSTGTALALLQRFTEKWSGTLNGSFTRDEYKGLFVIRGAVDERADDIFSVAPALRYKFRDWMFFDLAYVYSQRDSNFTLFDYESNTVFLRVNVSM